MKCEGCNAEIPDHKWGRIKKGEGWFFTRPTEFSPEKGYCPKHIPEWVEEWRERKAKERDER